MTHADLTRRIQMIVAGVMELPDDAVALDACLAELGADDLDVLEIVMEAETFADLELEDSEIETIKTVGNLVGCIAGRLGMRVAA